jgi:protein arginine N-methyltransferase 1
VCSSKSWSSAASWSCTKRSDNLMGNEYSISNYGGMIADRVRTGAYTDALRQAVKPGSVVLDIGTGPGFFALLACKFGARRVYAIEANDAIQVAREIAAANGYAERIEFVQNLSTKVTLPERADVIISDLRGVLPLFEHHITSIADARRRLLAPGGVMIPLRDTIMAAVVEAPSLYGTELGTWNGAGHGFDMRAARNLVANRTHKARIGPDQLLSEPQPWAVLDYQTVEDPNMHAELTWTTLRDGTAHGIVLWFDATLAEGVGFSNAPGAAELIYGGSFFPWLEPVQLAAGDTVSVVLQADLVGGDYSWRWDTSIRDQRQATLPKRTFKQATLFGMSLSATRLHRRHAGYVPLLNEAGRSDSFILSLMGGGRSLGEIARRASIEFPARFASEQDALTRVFDLSDRYSQ